jgi:Copper binding proteins, plastocyanin/azurin family
MLLVRRRSRGELVPRHRIALATLLVTIGLGVAACGDDDEDDAAPAETTPATVAGDGTTLQGSVGPGFEISVDGADGLAAGSYTLVVNDQSPEHNFHLTGPGGVDVSTSVSAEGEESFEVELEAGEYAFVCDPHASQMNGSFTVGG